jgi:hypothetical protein
LIFIKIQFLSIKNLFRSMSIHIDNNQVCVTELPLSPPPPEGKKGRGTKKNQSGGEK